MPISDPAAVFCTKYKCDRNDASSGDDKTSRSIYIALICTKLKSKWLFIVSNKVSPMHASLDKCAIDESKLSAIFIKIIYIYNYAATIVAQ